MARQIPEGRFQELIARAADVFIDNGYRRTQMAELVENFTRAQILEFIQGLSKDLDARRLAIYSTGQFEDSVPEKGVLLEDPTADWS